MKTKKVELSWLIRLNKRYDALQEPKRFLCFLALVLPALIFQFIEWTATSYSYMFALLMLRILPRWL